MAVALGFGVLALFSVQGRAAAIREVEVGTALESWYHVNPLNEPSLVPPAAGIPPPEPPEDAPALSPFPAGNLHVGVTSGVETARSYVRLATSALTGEIVGGSLRLPLVTDPDSGAVTPEAAELLVCFAPDPGPDDVDGGTGALPEVDCSTSSTAIAQAGDAPVLVADLSSFGELLERGGLALLPGRSAVADQETWRVVIQGSDPADPTSGIRATLTLEVPDPTTGTPDVETGDFSPSFDMPTGFDSGEGLSFDEPRAEVVPVQPDASGPPPPPVEEPPVASGPFGFAPDDGFAYSAVLLLPVSLIAALGWFGTNLTRPISDA